MFSYGPLHMDVPVLADQQELIYNTGCSLENLLGMMDDRYGRRCCITIIIMIMRADSVVSDMNGFISFCLQPLATKAYVNHTMLNSPCPNTRCILWCLRSQFISVDWDPNWSDLIRSEKPNRALQWLNLNSRLFQNSQILKPYLLGMTSSTHLIHSNCTSSPICCLGVYHDGWWLSYPFCMGMWVPHLNQETLSRSKLYQTK